ncbi:MAG: hypothetical protein ACYC2Y_08760 [Armatimonadota bacterium]
MKRIMFILMALFACYTLFVMGVSLHAQNQNVVARTATIDGIQVGEVVANGDVIFRIRSSAGGLSPYQRAQTVAQRLDSLMAAGLSAEDITTGRRNGQDVVLANNQVVVTADRAHAAANNTTPLLLADTWATRLTNVVSGRAASETPVGQKVVPIISVGRGVRVGGALVTGSRERLAEVRAVAQIEGQFGNSVRVRVLVPVSTENVVQNISRVPETSVIGLVDIPL